MEPAARHGRRLWLPLGGLLRRIVAGSARRVLATRQDARDPTGTERWTADEIEQLLEGLEAWAARLRPTARLDRLPTVGTRVMVELALLSVAAYRALLDQGQSRDAAADLLADIGWDAYARGLRLASLPARLVTRDPGKRVKWTIRLMLFFPFSPASPHGYEVRTWTEGDRIFTHWTRCPPQETVRRIIETHGDRGDLEAFGRSWCRYDWPGADLIAGDGRKGHYCRTRTLSRGDPVCDMCWMGAVQASAGADAGSGRPALGAG